MSLIRNFEYNDVEVVLVVFATFYCCCSAWRSIQQWQRRCKYAYVCVCMCWGILIVEFLTEFTTPNFPKRTRNFLVFNFPFHKSVFAVFPFSGVAIAPPIHSRLISKIHSVFPHNFHKSFIVTHLNPAHPQSILFSRYTAKNISSCQKHFAHIEIGKVD